jgi:hypothetical protein
VKSTLISNYPPISGLLIYPACCAEKLGGGGPSVVGGVVGEEGGVMLGLGKLTSGINTYVISKWLKLTRICHLKLLI